MFIKCLQLVLSVALLALPQQRKLIAVEVLFEKLNKRLLIRIPSEAILRVAYLKAFQMKLTE